MHEEFCIVSDFPEKLEVNDRYQPHSTSGASHRWRDGFEIYHLNGVRFDKEMYWKIVADYEDELLPIPKEWRLNPEEKAKYILAIKDVDRRTQAMAFLEPQKLIDALKGEVLDEYTKLATNGKEVTYRLYKFPKGDVFQQDAFYMYFTCPSTDKKHLEGVEVSKTVPEAMAWRQECTEEEWMLMVPLAHET